MEKNEVIEDDFKSSSVLNIKNNLQAKNSTHRDENEETHLLKKNPNELNIGKEKDQHSNHDYNTFLDNKNSKTNAENVEKNIIDQNNDDKSTLDKYLDSIGYNYFQLTTIFIVCYVFFVDGSEMVLINLILSSIQRDWKISIFERSILSSAVFFGFFFGSFISGYLTNR